MTTITLSRQLGSGGDQIAARVSELLNYRLFDKSMILQVAADVGLSESEIVDFSEDSHTARNFFERLFGGSRTVARSRVWVETPGGERQAQDVRLDDQSSVAITQASVQAAFRRGNVIIIGRGGQAILRGRKDVLHVRIQAPFDVRVRRIAAQEKITVEEAEARVKARDISDVAWIKRHFDLDSHDPQFFDLIINTTKFTQAAAVDLILKALALLPATGK